MKVNITEDAELDIINAYEWYQSQAKLGAKFINHLDKAFGVISLFPKASPVIKQNIRRCLLQKFPYIIYYTIKDEEAFILAIWHSKKQQSKLSFLSNETVF